MNRVVGVLATAAGYAIKSIAGLAALGGLAAIVYGISLIYIPAAWIIGGAMAVALFGYLPPTRRS